MKADVFPAFGHKFIDDVNAADIRTLMIAIDGRGARDIAKRAHETTGQIFRYAIAHGFAIRNPATDFKPSDILAERSSENFARVDAKKLPTLLTRMQGYEGRLAHSPCHAAAGISAPNLPLRSCLNMIGFSWIRFKGIHPVIVSNIHSITISNPDRSN